MLKVYVPVRTLQHKPLLLGLDSAYVAKRAHLELFLEAQVTFASYIRLHILAIACFLLGAIFCQMPSSLTSPYLEL